MHPIHFSNRYEHLDSESESAMANMQEDDSLFAVDYKPKAGTEQTSSLRTDTEISRVDSDGRTRPLRKQTTAPIMHLGNKTCIVIAAAVAACVGIGLGVIIGWFSSQAQFAICESGWKDALQEEDKNVGEMLVNEMKASNIKEYLR